MDGRNLAPPKNGMIGFAKSHRQVLFRVARCDMDFATIPRCVPQIWASGPREPRGGDSLHASGLLDDEGAEAPNGGEWFQECDI